MLFMVIEKYRDGDPKPVYRRLKEKGRMAPNGARYVSSWVTTDFERCFQVMDCDDRGVLGQVDVQLERHCRFRGHSDHHIGEGFGRDRAASLAEWRAPPAPHRRKAKRPRITDPGPLALWRRREAIPQTPGLSSTLA